MMMTRRGALLSTAAVATLLLGAGQAVAAGGTLIVDRDDIDLVSSDLVNVPVTYQCPSASAPDDPNTFSSLSVVLQQSRAGALTLGGGGAEPVCDGAPHTLTLVVQRSLGPGYKTGRAHFEASLSQCTYDPVVNNYECTDVRDADFVHIGK